MNTRISSLIKLNRILILIFIATLLYTAFNLINVYVKTSTEQRELDLLNAEFERVTIANDSLNARLEEGLSESAIARIAREDLDLAMPGERIIVDASGSN